MIHDPQRRIDNLLLALNRINDIDSWTIHVDDEVSIDLTGDLMREVIRQAICDEIDHIDAENN